MEKGTHRGKTIRHRENATYRPRNVRGSHGARREDTVLMSPLSPQREPMLLSFGFPDPRTVAQCLFLLFKPHSLWYFVAAAPGIQYSYSDSNFSIQLRLPSSRKTAQKSDEVELSSIIWASYLISPRLFPHM